MPSPLIEFRYYLIPWLFLQFEIKPFLIDNREKSKESSQNSLNSSLYPVLSAYILTNIAVFYLFLYKPFVYINAGEKEVGRFMW